MKFALKSFSLFLSIFAAISGKVKTTTTRNVEMEICAYGADC